MRDLYLNNFAYNVPYKCLLIKKAGQMFMTIPKFRPHVTWTEALFGLFFFNYHFTIALFVRKLIFGRDTIKGKEHICWCYGEYTVTQIKLGVVLAPLFQSSLDVLHPMMVRLGNYKRVGFKACIQRALRCPQLALLQHIVNVGGHERCNPSTFVSGSTRGG